MPFICSFAGQARSGKNVAADHTCEQLNKISTINWKRASLGLNVKKIFAEHFGVTLEFIEEWKVKKEIPPGFNGLIRDGLTLIGDGWRNLKEDIWLEKLFTGNTDNLILSDNRYRNESCAIRGESNYPYMQGHKGVTCLLWRPGYENDKPSLSEQELMPFVRHFMNTPSGIINHPDIPFNIWLRNNGTEEEFLNKINRMVIPYVIEKFNLI